MTQPSISGAWKNGPKITKEDLENGCQYVELISREELFEGNMELARQSVSEKKNKQRIMSFGKYKGKEVEWVRKNNPNYFAWALENVEFFSKQVKYSIEKYE